VIQVSIVIPYYKENQKIYLWMQRRSSSDSLDGLLEFPGGKKEENESSLATAIREVKEEVGIDIETKNTRFVGEHNAKIVSLSLYLNDNMDLWPKEGWVEINDKCLESLEIPPENKLFLPRILESIKSAI